MFLNLICYVNIIYFVIVVYHLCFPAIYKFKEKFHITQFSPPPPPFQNHPPLLGSPLHFLKSPISPTLLANWSSQGFLINKNLTVLSSINTIHVKLTKSFHFQVHNYMPGNVCINEMHARQGLYIISLYCREGFSHPFNFLLVSKGILHIYFQNS